MEENKETTPLEESDNVVYYDRELLNVENLTKVIAKMWKDKTNAEYKIVSNLWVTEEEFKQFIKTMQDKHKDNKHNARCK